MNTTLHGFCDDQMQPFNLFVDSGQGCGTLKEYAAPGHVGTAEIAHTHAQTQQNLLSHPRPDAI
ncbi:hypothetical protein [Ruegeria sp. YS9]|uniref:hypothetical protein n=1 Tax=Ruegeria sp. YS9 TaxID=2966453 RepID=UPI00214AD6FF|nr:hypothetical protein [Ruegeria sp. YS9]UUV06434.1 hypothetical protein NOR97_01395 [Ruegeria sp. YS9]